jgi:hypothetical protein
MSKVSELIDPTNGTWDERLIRDNFCEQDIGLILTILVFEDTSDEWAWHFDDKGMFSVKSAYRLQRQLVDVWLGKPECSDPRNIFKWKDIWRTECTPKVRQFLWCISHNSPLYKLSLKRRGMDIDTICPMCNRLDEDGYHMFLKCKSAKSLWRQLHFEEVHKKLMECTEPKEVLAQIFHLNKEQKLLTVALLWWRWRDRNKVVAGEFRNSEAHLFQLIKVAAEFQQFCMKEKVKSSKSVQVWEAPNGDELKLNIDGSFCQLG